MPAVGHRVIVNGSVHGAIATIVKRPTVIITVLPDGQSVAVSVTAAVVGGQLRITDEVAATAVSAVTK